MITIAAADIGTIALGTIITAQLDDKTQATGPLFGYNIEGAVSMTSHGGDILRSKFTVTLTLRGIGDLEVPFEAALTVHVDTRGTE